MYQNQIIIIFWKRVFKQTVGEVEGKSKIVAIFNKYKNTLNNLIDSLDTESLDCPDFSNWLGLIDKRSRNTLKSRGSSSTFLEEDCLNEDVSIMLLEPTSKI